MNARTEWWQEPVVLALVGAIALHVLAFVSFDTIVIYTPKRTIELPPHVELVDLALPTPKPPPPPSKVEPEPQPEPEPVRPAPARHAAASQPRTSTPPPTETPPATPPPSEPQGGGREQTYNLPEGDVADAVGKHGTKTDDRIRGRTGSGAGAGSGSGQGSGSGAVAPITSIATIKTPAKVKGDFSYFGEKDYPAEAKTLGIEGDIKIQLVVDDKGQVKRKRLLTKLGHGLDELALAKAAQLAFEPALDTEDKPVTSVVVWTFHMTLPK